MFWFIGEFERSMMPAEVGSEVGSTADELYLCLKCNGVVAAARQEAHDRYWCTSAEGGSDSDSDDNGDEPSATSSLPPPPSAGGQHFHSLAKVTLIGGLSLTFEQQVLACRVYVRGFSERRMRNATALADWPSTLPIVRVFSAR